jgi:FeS assembly SUF system protein
MTEKIRETDETDGPERAEPDAVPGDIKGCVGATGGGEGDGSAIPPVELEQLRSDLVSALKTVFDPEIPVDIYELGLIYRLDVDDDRNIEVDMTLTAPGCPVAGDMPGWVENAVSSVPGVGQVKVNLVFDPPWDMSRMSDEARLALNMF